MGDFVKIRIKARASQDNDPGNGIFLGIQSFQLYDFCGNNIVANIAPQPTDDTNILTISEHSDHTNGVHNDYPYAGITDMSGVIPGNRDFRIFHPNNLSPNNEYTLAYIPVTSSHVVHCRYAYIQNVDVSLADHTRYKLEFLDRSDSVTYTLDYDTDVSPNNWVAWKLGKYDVPHQLPSVSHSTPRLDIPFSKIRIRTTPGGTSNHNIQNGPDIRISRLEIYDISGINIIAHIPPLPSDDSQIVARGVYSTPLPEYLGGGNVTTAPNDYNDNSGYIGITDPSMNFRVNRWAGLPFYNDYTLAYIPVNSNVNQLRSAFIEAEDRFPNRHAVAAGNYSYDPFGDAAWNDFSLDFMDDSNNIVYHLGDINPYDYFTDRIDNNSGDLTLQGKGGLPSGISMGGTALWKLPNYNEPFPNGSDVDISFSKIRIKSIPIWTGTNNNNNPGDKNTYGADFIFEVFELYDVNGNNIIANVEPTPSIDSRIIAAGVNDYSQLTYKPSSNIYEYGTGFICYRPDQPSLLPFDGVYTDNNSDGSEYLIADISVNSNLSQLAYSFIKSKNGITRDGVFVESQGPTFQDVRLEFIDDADIVRYRLHNIQGSGQSNPGLPPGNAVVHKLAGYDELVANNNAMVKTPVADITVEYPGVGPDSSALNTGHVYDVVDNIYPYTISTHNIYNIPTNQNALIEYTNDPLYNAKHTGLAMGMGGTHNTSSISDDEFLYFNNKKDGKLHFYTSGTGHQYLSTPSLTINNGSGELGINNPDPLFALDVKYTGGGGGNTGYKYWAYHANYVFVNTFTWNNVTVKLDDNLSMGCGSNGGFISYSDKRIKNNIKDVSGSHCLAKTLLLKPCQYEYINENYSDTNVSYGFIADEVEEVFPNSVNEVDGFVPNIAKYGSCSIDASGNQIIDIIISNVSYDTKDLNIDSSGNVLTKLLLLDSSWNHIEDVTITNVLSSSSLMVKCSTLLPSLVFIYGQFVNDVKTLQYDDLFTHFISALKESDRLLQERKTKRMYLENKLDELITLFEQ